MRPRSGVQRLALIAIATIAVIVGTFLVWGEAFEAWTAAQLGGYSSFTVTVAGSALLALDIFLPVPSSLVGILLGSNAGFAMGTFAGFLGLTIGCIIGYWFGRVFGKADRPAKEIVSEGRAQSILDRYGLLALVMFRPVPVLAETSIILAGAAKMPFGKVLGVSAMANLGVSMLYAAIGSSLSVGTAAGLTLIAFASVLAIKVAKRTAAIKSDENDSGADRH